MKWVFDRSQFPYECRYYSITNIHAHVEMDTWIVRTIEDGTYDFTGNGVYFMYEEDLVAFKLRFGL